VAALTAGRDATLFTLSKPPRAVPHGPLRTTPTRTRLRATPPDPPSPTSGGDCRLQATEESGTGSTHFRVFVR
jgi:hypothetical protein